MAKILKARTRRPVKYTPQPAPHKTVQQQEPAPAPKPAERH
jgi:hypothetical protein